MANVGSLKSKSKPAPPPPEAAGRMLEAEPAKPAVPSLLDLARQKQAEKAAKSEVVKAPAEEPAPKVDRRRGRPKRTEDVRGFAARVRPETYDRIQTIVDRDRWKLGPLVDEMVRLYEEQKVAKAEKLVGERLPGESDDDLIRRAAKAL